MEPEPIAVIPKQDSVDSKPYSNPVFFCGTGSSFGNYLQALYRQNRFVEMVVFTCEESRNKYGDEALKGFFETNFLFDFELGKLTSIKKSVDINFLIYSNAEIFGTKRKVVLKTIIENDSVRLVLDSLKNPFQYLPR